MKNKIFTTGEVLTIRTNIENIEKNLGYPVPGGMIDVSEIKDHILRPGEVLTYCSNIESVNKRNKYGRPVSHNRTCEGAATIGDVIKTVIILSAVCAVIMIAEAIFGFKIL